jgi:hypothetical protein
MYEVFDPVPAQELAIKKVLYYVWTYYLSFMTLTTPHKIPNQTIHAGFHQQLINKQSSSDEKSTKTKQFPFLQSPITSQSYCLPKIITFIFANFI